MSRSYGVAFGALTVAIVAATVPALIVPAAIVSSVAAVVAPGAPSRRPTGARPSAWPVVMGAVLIAARVTIGALGGPVTASSAEARPVAAAATGSAPSVAATATGSAPSVAAAAGLVRGEIASVMRRAGGRQDVLLSASGGAIVYARLPRFPEFGIGDVVDAQGPVEALPDDPAPDQAAWVGYLRRIGVTATLEARAAAPVDHLDDPATRLAAVRDAAGNALLAALPEPAAGLAAGILVGLRERVDPGLAKDFTAAGLTHVVAISGWNIAIVGAVCGALAGRLRRRSRALLVAAVIGGYTIFAGASPSVVRAALMAGVALISREGGRRAGATRALALAVTAMLIVDPAAVADPGFQLSSCATLGLIAWATPLDAWIERRARRLPGAVRESLAVSLAAQAATLPVVLFDFGRISLVSPLANLVAAPVVPFVMAAAAAALPLGLAIQMGVPSALLGVPVLLVDLPVEVLIAVGRAAAAVPYASVQLAPPIAMTAAAVALLGVLAVVRLRRSVVTTATGGSP
jgi:competence protein ComEC